MVYLDACSNIFQEWISDLGPRWNRRELSTICCQLLSNDFDWMAPYVDSESILFVFSLVLYLQWWEQIFGWQICLTNWNSERSLRWLWSHILKFGFGPYFWAFVNYSYLSLGISREFGVFQTITSSDLDNISTLNHKIGEPWYTKH